jgi:hypothetical protein
MSDVPDGSLPSPNPTASSTTTPSQPLPSGLADVDARLTRLEDELGEVCGVLQQMASEHESLRRAVRQQRWGRYLMWGTVIALLAIVYFTMRVRYPLG